MRLLHTSDWHLGQSFFGLSRRQEHQQFIDWLFALIQSEQIDAVLIAGDIFDTTTPPSYAKTLYHNFAATLAQQNIQLIVLAGNHDAIAVLEESQQLLGLVNVQVVANIGTDLSSQIIPLGNPDAPEAILCAVPYLRPQYLTKSQSNQSGDDKQQQLQQRIYEHYHQLYTQANTKNLPLIMTGHLSVAGSLLTQSVRDIYIGQLEAFPVNAFPPADYIALGHIHRQQIFSGHGPIAYSGSPIPLSFDESTRTKSVMIVDIKPEIILSSIAIPCFQPMARYQGSLAHFSDFIQHKLSSISTDQRLWLEVIIEQHEQLHDIQQYLVTAIADHPVDILKVQRQSVSALLQQESAEVTLAELTPMQVFSKRLDYVEGLEPEQQQALTQLFSQLLVNQD